MVGMELAAFIHSRAWLPAVAMVAIVLGGFGLQRSPRISAGTEPVFNSLARWRHGGHDWLVVADGKANELVVYNAADGRPLQRVRIKQKFQDFNTLVQRDGHLFVVADDGKLDELKLSPPLMAAATPR